MTINQLRWALIQVTGVILFGVAAFMLGRYGHEAGNLQSALILITMLAGGLCGIAIKWNAEE